MLFVRKTEEGGDILGLLTDFGFAGGDDVGLLSITVSNGGGGGGGGGGGIRTFSLLSSSDTEEQKRLGGERRCDII